MKLQDAIGGTIRHIRLEKNMTMRDVSVKGFISLGHLSEVESGHKSASPGVLEGIAKGLDITTSELVKEIYEYLKENNNE